MTITYNTLETLYAAYTTAQDAGDFDAMRAAHIDYLTATGLFIGVSQEAYIVLLYGKEALNAHSPVGALASAVEPAQTDPQAPAPHTTAPDMAAVARVEDASAAQTGPQARASAGGEAAVESYVRTEDSRYTGTLRWYGKYGYIHADGFMDNLRVTRTHICGAQAIPTYTPLPVEFSLSQNDAMGWHHAAAVVLVGNETSEKAYAAKRQPKPAPAYTPRADIVERARQSNTRERGIRSARKQDDAARKAANEKAMRDLFSGKF